MERFVATTPMAFSLPGRPTSGGCSAAAPRLARSRPSICRRAGLKRSLGLSTSLNFVATLDIIGGNSGSPVVNRNGELVGLVFDGNLEGLGGRFVYTDDKARAIVVDGRAMVEALTKIYDAREIVREITRR